MVTLSLGRRVEHEIVKGTMKSLTVSKILPVEYPPQIPDPHTRTGTPVNSLVRMGANTTVGAQQRLDLAYDHQDRRITKRRWNNTAGTGASGLDQKLIDSVWNLVAVLGADNSLLRSFAWRTALSGTFQGAGGVGGLPWIHDLSTLNNQPSTHSVAHDGNGNGSLLVNATDGTETARYEYGPLGEVIRATGPMAQVNPFRFSTKYQDDETDLIYYGYRYYNASTGRWLSSDPLGELGGVNLYAFLGNSPPNSFDPNGLCDGMCASSLNSVVTSPMLMGIVGIPTNCKELAARIRSFLNTPQETAMFDHFVGGNGAGYDLSSHMGSILRNASAFQQAAQMQRKLCGAWAQQWDSKSITFGDFVGSPYTYGLGHVTIVLNTHCSCGVLTWEACVKDNYDFNSLPWGQRPTKGEIFTRLVAAAQQFCPQWAAYRVSGCARGVGEKVVPGKSQGLYQ